MAQVPFAKLQLRDLPGPTKCVIGTFMIAIGLGYFSGLVQLHYQHAKPGNLMPTAEDAVEIYHGSTGRPISKMEKLIDSDGPFGGSGSMKQAFFEKSERKWDETLAKLSPEAREKLLKEREGERQALLDWIRAGGRKDTFAKNQHVLSDQQLVLTEDYVVQTNDNKRAVRIESLFTDRCVRCHMESGADKHAEKYPLDDYAKMAKYLEVKEAAPMDLTKLAQTTHVHLIGFTMMFCLTGLAFSFTSYPAFIRSIVAPWPMCFQVIDISCWWLGRYDPLFAQAILVTGGLVAVGLAVHILGTLLDLTGIVSRRRIMTAD